MKTLYPFVIISTGLVSASLVRGQEQIIPEPDQAALLRAEGVIKRLYRTAYATKFATEMRELAIQLLNKALETKDDHAARYVLYREAAELAARAGDFAGALAVIEELGNEFDTDIGSLKVRIIKAAASAAPAVAPKLLGEAALFAVPDAFAANDPAVAEDLLTIAESAAAKTKSAELKAAVDARRAELKDVLKEFESYRAALATLQSKPQDPGANLTAGKYACFIKGDWKRGLPYLSKGSDPVLKALATRDMAKPAEPTPQVELADVWWDYAETGATLCRRHVFGRAAYWYSEAAPNLQGLTLAKARDRVTTTYKQYPGLEPNGSAGASVFAPYAGIWEIRYANGAMRRYVIDIRGNVYALTLQHTVERGRMLPTADLMQLSFPTQRGKVEKLSIKDGALLVQHFNPPNRLATTGIGQKRELPEKKGAAIESAANFRDIAGIWLAAQSDKSYRIYIFGPRGSGIFMTNASALEGTLARKPDHVVLDCNDDKIVRIKPAGTALRIDVFHPASTYPASEPGVASTAIRLSRWVPSQ